MNAMQQLMPLFNIPGRPAAGGFGLGFLQTLGFSGGGFGGFGAATSTVSSGDYVVVLNVGGKTYRQKLRVEKAAPGGVFGFSAQR